jgi:two-component system, OmpR family, sensor histidine kinase AdeS
MGLVPKSLRGQFALAMALYSVGSVLVILAALLIFAWLFEPYLQAQTPPVVQGALKALEAGQALTAEQSKEVFKYYDGTNATGLDIIMLILFFIPGIVLGAAVGAFIGSRVARPIEAVAKAARSISEGQLSARALLPQVGRGETGQLVKNFNALADGLEVAERELTGSASAIAHELRTPVTILKARLQAISDGLIKPDAGEFEGLVAQADLLSNIVDDMLDLSLAGAGKMHLKPELINLAAEVKLAMKSLEPQLREAGISVEIAAQDCRISADPARIRQMLNALVENAWRYAASGGVVRIETRTDISHARIGVYDRGPGLPAGAETKVFDRFWRGEPSRTRKSGGAGLGLAVVKAIAEAHGGEVKAFNRAGGGAGFEISLPT